MMLNPARPEKKRRGVWGGVVPPVGSGFGIPPAARVRVRPHYPELPVPGPRRDMGWVWDWVLGLGNISRILENVADSDFQYFQASQNTEKLRFPIFPGFWRMLGTSISNISRILENVADLVDQIIRYDAEE